MELPFLWRARRLTLAAAAVAALTALSACDDAPTEPLAALVTAETAAALDVEAGLPYFPLLLERARRASDPAGAVSGGHGEVEARALDTAAALWSRALVEPRPERAAQFRDAAYRTAAGPVARRLGPAEVDANRAEVARWLAAAERALDRSGPEGIAARVAEARAWLESASEMAAVEDAEASLLAALRAGDALAETTADAVAGRLIRAVDALMAERAVGDSALDEATWRRADRLVRGAREARAAGDPVRAIRRAYYAAQLLKPE